MYFNFFISTFFDFIIFYIACNNLFEKRKIKREIKIITSLFIFLISFIIIIYANSILLKYLVLIVLISIMMNILFEGNKMIITLAIIGVYSVFFMMDFALISALNIDVRLERNILNQINVFEVSILSKFLSLLLVLMITRKNKNRITLASKYSLKFMIISFFTIIGLLSIIIPTEEHFITSRYVASTILMLNNVFIYYLLKDFIELSEDLRIKSLSDERASNILILWNKMRKKDKLQRQMMHDYSDTLLCIKGLLNKNEIEKLKECVEEITFKYQLSKSFVETGDSLLDVLINSKYEQALANDITMILKLDNLSDVKIKSEDMLILISNLMNNAIEYCLKLPKNKREIFFSIYNAESIEIMLRNPLEHKLTIENGLIKSNKEGSNHGIGMLSIKEIVEKYKGECGIDIDNGYFTYFIEI